MVTQEVRALPSAMLGEINFALLSICPLTLALSPLGERGLGRRPTDELWLICSLIASIAPT